MKSFRFTLEALGTVRRRQEQKAQELYAQTLLARRQALDNLDAVERELSASWQELRGDLAGGCTAAKAAQAHAYQRTLVQRRDECNAALETAERRVNSALQAMLLARQQREIVDKFYERQKTVHQRDQVRGEQKFLDDLTSRRGSSILAWKPADMPL